MEGGGGGAREGGGIEWFAVGAGECEAVRERALSWSWLNRFVRINCSNWCVSELAS